MWVGLALLWGCAPAYAVETKPVMQPVLTPPAPNADTPAVKMPSLMAHAPQGRDVAQVDDEGLIVPLASGDKLPPAEFLRQFSSFLDNPTVPQPIPPHLFQNFWLQWGMVTTRYKPDGGELRFTYANKIAAEALATGEYPFPEGSVLAKIGAKAMLDPGFSSSLVPGSIERVQVMLKKANDPNARDGWVYALYTQKYRGQLTKDEINACQACHLLVPERDMVFSQPFPTAFGATLANMTAAEPFVDKFKLVALEKLKPALQDIVRQQKPVPTQVMLLEMPTFSGTIFESREITMRLTRKNKIPYVLTSPDGAEFLINILDGDKGCVNAYNTVSNPPPINWKAVVGQPQPRPPPRLKDGKPMTTMRHNCLVEQ